jgi:hypothetical protein
MSMSLNILRTLSSSIPASYLAQSFIVLPPTTFLIRGFLLERTITPGDYFFHKVVAPLWRPMPSIVLNYSERLAGGKRITISRDNFDEQIKNMLSEALPLIDELRALQSPADFLNFLSHSGRKSNSGPDFTDLACAHLLNGSASDCIQSLKKLEMESHRFNPSQRAIYAKAATELLAALDRSEASAIALLTAWREENVLKFKLIA